MSKEIEISALLRMGSVKNVGVDDTPRISEPLYFLKNHCFFTGSYRSICRCFICRIQAVLLDHIIRTARLNDILTPK
jgi:hypothetical protein